MRSCAGCSATRAATPRRSTAGCDDGWNTTRARATRTSRAKRLATTQTRTTAPRRCEASAPRGCNSFELRRCLAATASASAFCYNIAAVGRSRFDPLPLQERGRGLEGDPLRRATHQQFVPTIRPRASRLRAPFLWFATYLTPRPHRGIVVSGRSTEGRTPQFPCPLEGLEWAGDEAD